MTNQASAAVLLSVETLSVFYDKFRAVEEVSLEDLVLAYMGQAIADEGDGSSEPGVGR